MALRRALAILTVALLAAAASAGNSTFQPSVVLEVDGHGLVGDALELEDEMMLGSEETRRLMAGGSQGYISYGAMGRNRVPCNQRGKSYYNCNSHQKANPYQRGCTRATKCARNNH